MQRKIAWESQHYDFNPISGKLKQTEEGEYSPESENEHDTMMDLADAAMPIREMVMTPVGIWSVDDSMHPLKQFKFWMGHTNFNISEKCKNLIKKVPGVEALKVITRYRFLIAVGKMFDTGQTKVAIQDALCGISVKDVELADGKLLSEVLVDLKDNCKDWVIYVLPNGKYEYAGTDKVEDIPYLDRKAFLYEASIASNGIYITSDTQCNLIGKK